MKRQHSCRLRYQSPVKPIPDLRKLFPSNAGFVRGLEDRECAWILFSEFQALKVLEFSKLALKSLEFVNVNLSSAFVRMHNYAASRRVKTCKYRVETRTYIALRKRCVMPPWSRRLLTSPLGRAVKRWFLCFLSMKKPWVLAWNRLEKPRNASNSVISRV